jgi:hypothetical protein
MAKQTKVTIETESLLILGGRGSLRMGCPECAAEGEMIPVGVISNLAPAEVGAWFASEAIHHSRAADGAQLICLNSLLKLVKIPKTA